MLPLGCVNEIHVAKGQEGSLTCTQNDELYWTSYHLGLIQRDDSGLGARCPLYFPMMKHCPKRQRRFWTAIGGQIDDVACS